MRHPVHALLNDVLQVLFYLRRSLRRGLPLLLQNVVPSPHRVIHIWRVRVGRAATGSSLLLRATSRYPFSSQWIEIFLLTRNYT